MIRDFFVSLGRRVLPRTVKQHCALVIWDSQAMMFPSFDHGLHESLWGSDDYFRFATLGLALRRIEDERIPGSLAEVGVYRGNMSRFIHQACPSRTLYLFDTFAGFHPGDREAGDGTDERFRDTCLEGVKARIGDCTNVVFRPGYVPETLSGLEEERFAFVLLDLDKHKPTAASLEFFYPRLAPGGYLVVHDYNNPESNWACKRALDAFLQDKSERIVEIADRWGTALIRKQCLAAEAAEGKAACERLVDASRP